MEANIERFINSFLEFDEMARSNVGYDEKLFQEVCKNLQALKPSIQKSRIVPIELANVFIDLWGSIESSTYRHNPEIAQKLRYAAETLSNIARDVTSTR